MTFLIILNVIVVCWVVFTFSRNDELESAVAGLLATIIFLPMMFLTSLATGTDWGREMELCDQAGGAYSLWTNECTTPTEVIEIGNDE